MHRVWDTILIERFTIDEDAWLAVLATLDTPKN